LSVYGTVGAELTWNAYALAEDITGREIPGDLNNNGGIDTADAAMILRHLGGTKLLSSDAQVLADINKDGKINTVDVRWILLELVK